MNGGCFNISEDTENILRAEGRLYSLQIPGVPVTFCFDVFSIVSRGLTNDAYNIVNLPIQLLTGDTYMYPLTEDDAESFIGQAALTGVEIDSYPKLKIQELVDLEDTKRQLNRLKREVK